MSFVFDLSSKKISLQKSSAFEFLNLTLKKREAFGIAPNHWLSLAFAKEKISETDSVLLLEYTPVKKKPYRQR